MDKGKTTMMVERFIKRVVRYLFRKRWHIRNAYIANVLLREYVDDYRKYRDSWYKVLSIHHKGFSVSNWIILNLTKDNYKRYLSNVQYCRLHPINGEYSYIIDDKWTLKQNCAKTELDKYMPEYYYRIDSEGKIECLMDCPYISENCSVKDISMLLREKGTLAIKKTAGSLGIGFFKAEFKSGSYFLNGKEFNEDGLCCEIMGLRDYLITEYLYTNKELAKFCPNTCNCIRYLAGRIDGKFHMLKSFIRFGTKESSFVENYGAGGVLCYLNENGCFYEGNVIDFNRGTNRRITHHPDTGKELMGEIPLWSEVLDAVKAFEMHFPKLTYLGFDFVITSNNKVKILEINSLTSLDTLQLDGSILETNAGDFYRLLMK